MSAGTDHTPRYLVVPSSGTGYLTDRVGLVEILERLTEFDWYVAEDVPMVPAIWINAGGNDFHNFVITRRDLGGSRTCIEEEWTRTDKRTEQVVEQLTTLCAEPEPAVLNSNGPDTVNQSAIGKSRCRSREV